MTRVLAGTCIAFAFGCTAIANIDVCERGTAPEAELNVDALGDQLVQNVHGVAPMPDGRLFVAFTSIDGRDPLRAEVRGLRFGDDARRLTTCGRTEELTYASHEPGGPQVFAGDTAIAAPDDSAYPVAMAYAEDTPDGDRVFLHAIDGDTGCPFYDGTPIDSLPLLLEDAPGDAIGFPRVIWTGEYTFDVLWVFADLDGGVRSSIHARAFQITEGGVMPLDLVDPQSGERTRDRVVAVTPDGSLGFDAIGFDDRIVLARYVTAGGGYRIEVSFHREDMSILIPSFPITDIIPNLDQASPVMAWDGAQLMVVWTEQIDETFRVRGRFLTPDGNYLSSSLTPDGAPFSLSTSPSSEESHPAIVELAGGGFIVAWTATSLSGDAQDVRATIISPSGERTFANRACEQADFRLNQATAGNQGRVALTRLGSSPVAVWADDGQNGSDSSGLALRASVIPIRELLAIE